MSKFNDNSYSKPVLKNCNYSDYNKWYIPLIKPGHCINSFNNTLCLELDPINGNSKINLCSKGDSIDSIMNTNFIRNENLCLDICSSIYTYVLSDVCNDSRETQKWAVSFSYNNIGKNIDDKV
ncbi:hypothetical protein BCR36DRAFT_372692 [Piromyces finnis]|uniref:Ricin B lectin domain-containing protein n=1 Tax=Piromyces finnis TaxID=1754191 RepID=A0A1Y1V287_9FUNG|nr:hypothetical protein BCR36DRAFT_372692 [Piromyces finnis]|eukprot:ORX45637.1 hypothetical protein BCR36DRAFT_372692 [Piromyces finnis]